MDAVEKVAEAVLYEGYLLYPYRRSALKNQQRWTFGGVYPRAYSEASGGDDPWIMQTQCLVVGDEDTSLEVKVRFLHVVDRLVAKKVGGGAASGDCLVEELHGLEQIFFCTGAKRNAINQVFGSKIEIVRNEVVSWRFLNRDFLVRRDFCSKAICDFLRDLALDRKHVIQIPTVALRPNTRAGARVD